MAQVRAEEARMHMAKVITEEVADDEEVKKLLEAGRALRAECHVDMKCRSSWSADWIVRRPYKWYIFSDYLLVTRRRGDTYHKKALWGLSSLNVHVARRGADADARAISMQVARDKAEGDASRRHSSSAALPTQHAPEAPSLAPAAKSEAPPADASASAPEAEAPPADAPKAEAPPADAPQAEAPPADAPQAEAPLADAPAATPDGEPPPAGSHSVPVLKLNLPSSSAPADAPAAAAGGGFALKLGPLNEGEPDDGSVGAAPLREQRGSAATTSTSDGLRTPRGSLLTPRSSARRGLFPLLFTPRRRSEAARGLDESTGGTERWDSAADSSSSSQAVPDGQKVEVFYLTLGGTEYKVSPPSPLRPPPRAVLAPSRPSSSARGPPPLSRVRATDS